MATNVVQTSKSQLEDFLHRINHVGLHVAESSTNCGGNWEVVDEEEIQDEQDKNEWILIGKTETEKQEEQERKAKERMKKRAKRISQH